MSERDNTSSATDESSATLWGGLDEEDAERLEPRRPLYLAWAWREPVRLDEHGDRTGDPDGTGFVNYAELYFARFADAERWVHWQLAQWPPLVEENGDLLETTGEIYRVVFLRRDPEWPRDPAPSEEYAGFTPRVYHERVSPELETLAIQLAEKASSHGSSAQRGPE
jgi:hypothetical protein